MSGRLLWTSVCIQDFCNGVLVLFEDLFEAAPKNFLKRIPHVRFVSSGLFRKTRDASEKSPENNAEDQKPLIAKVDMQVGKIIYRLTAFF